MADDPHPQYTDDALYFLNASASSNSDNLFDDMDDPGGKAGQGPVNSQPQFTNLPRERQRVMRLGLFRPGTTLEPGVARGRQI